MLNAVTNANAVKTPALIIPKYAKNNAVIVVIKIEVLNATSDLYLFSDKKLIKNVEININSPNGMPIVVGYFIKSNIDSIFGASVVMFYTLLLCLLFQKLRISKLPQQLRQQTKLANLDKMRWYFLVKNIDLPFLLKLT